MYRGVDLTFKPYPAPVGNGEGVIRPVMGYRPGPPILHEPLNEERTLADVLSYYRVSTSMSGIQPGEIFSKGLLTTKPYTTYATFENQNEGELWGAQYLAELSPEDLTGAFTLVDMTGVAAGEVISAQRLKAAVGSPVPTRILFLRTDYSKRRPQRPTAEYFTQSPTLAPEAAQWLTTLGIRVLGTDLRTVDPRYAGRADDDVYGILNHSGIVVIDDLCNLDAIQPEHDLAIVGIPLPIRWVLGGPARVFAVNMNEPTDFIDCSHSLDTYPQLETDDSHPFVLPESNIALNDIGDYPNPWPGRIEPREDQGMTQKAARLTPFRFLDPSGKPFGREMYIEYGHGTGTHIECAFFDPWGRHGVPDEVMRRYVRIPKDRLVSEACLLDLSEEVGPLQQIDYTHLRRVDPGLKRGDICVLRADITDWYFYGSAPGKTPGLSPDAAKWLVDKGIRALVLDFAAEKSDPMPSTPVIKYTPNKIHYFLHKNDIPIVEWTVNMKNIRKDRFTMAICAMPASHQGGFPSQVFAIEKW